MAMLLIAQTSSAFASFLPLHHRLNGGIEAHLAHWSMCISLAPTHTYTHSVMCELQV